MIRLYRSVNTYWFKYADVRPHAFRQFVLLFSFQFVNRVFSFRLIVVDQKRFYQHTRIHQLASVQSINGQKYIHPQKRCSTNEYWLESRMVWLLACEYVHKQQPIIWLCCDILRVKFRFTSSYTLTMTTEFGYKLQLPRSSPWSILFSVYVRLYYF